MQCYNCLSQQSEYYAEENGYMLVKCSACGLLYVQNPPSLDQITNAHTQGLHGGKKTIQVTGRYDPFAVKRYSSILGDLFENGLQDEIHWLDVGCGYGEFIEALKEFGPRSLKILGSEPNVHKQKSARARGLDVQFIDLNMHQNKYDYISLLNVYSHLPNPPLFLSKLKDILKPNGEIIIETGDTANLSASDHYRPFYVPDHLSFASEKIVTDILLRLGFEIIALKKYPFMPLSAATVAKELIKIFLPGYRSGLLALIAPAKKLPPTDMYIRARKI